MEKLAYQKILVCCDGSKYSEKALLHACKLAKINKSRISLIYVVDKTIGLDIFDRREYLKVLRNYGKKVLKKASEFTSEREIPSDQVFKEGKVADEIIKFAKKGNYNLIVAGSKGLGKFTKLFLGSVSHKLANQSKCSVLIVK